jgi:hypothetical protein
MKALTRWVFIILVGYLSVSLLADWYVERNYRYQLLHHLLVIGKDGFIKTDSLQGHLNGDPELQMDLHFLTYTPPFGWLFLRSLVHLEDATIFASKNLALPEAQRFPDPSISLQYGFSPDDREEGKLVHALCSQIW